MLKYIQKNKVFVAALVLFALLFLFGNNMEFYDNSTKKCNKELKPDKFPDYKESYLDPSDDVVLKRRDQKQLESEKIGRFKYDGLDNWDIISDVNKGWLGDHVQPGGLYPAPIRSVWPD